MTPQEGIRKPRRNLLRRFRVYNAKCRPQRPTIQTSAERYESGTSATEIIVTLAILAAVSIPIMGALQSTTRTDARIEHTIEAQQRTALAVTQLTADIRTGVLTPDLRSGDPLTHNLPLVLSRPDGTDLLVVWSFTDQGLVRHSGPAVSGGSRTTIVMLEHAVPGPKEQPFIYLTDIGNPLDPLSNTQTLQACTAQIQIRLFLESDRDEITQTNPYTTSASFRQRLAIDSCN